MLGFSGAVFVEIMTAAAIGTSRIVAAVAE
jgi:hypothetical protein